MLKDKHVRSHLSRNGVVELNEHRYEEFECDYCDETFRIKDNHARSLLYQRARPHLEAAHHDEVTRDEYPNEAAFIEWAEEEAAELIVRDEPGKPVVAIWGDGREVHLEPDGSILLRQFRHIGSGDVDVRKEGSRLVIEDSRGRHHVSARDWPIDQF